MTYRSGLKLFFFFLLFTTSVFTVQAQTTISGERGYISGSDMSLTNYTDPMLGGYTSYQEVGQTFTSALTTSIGTIEFYVENLYSAGNCDVQIFSCSSTTAWGTLLGTKTNVSITAAGWITVDVSALNIHVAAGSYYGYKLIPLDGLDAGIGVNGNLYVDGEGWMYNGNGTTMFTGMDYPFTVSANSVLPIGLISLTAQKQLNNVVLQWSTSSEQNTKAFTIQHSTNAADWKNIGSLAAGGNSNAIRNYTYLHTTPVQGNNYYRLIQTDSDGKYSFSNIKAIKFISGQASFTVVSNPVINNVLKVQVNSKIYLSLYNAVGRLIWKKQFEPGLQNINTDALAKGIYILKTDDATERIVVQ